MVSDQTSDKRQIPAWLLGLVIAAILFVIGVFVFSALGFGDNPVLEQVFAPMVWLVGDRAGWREQPHD